MSDNRDNRAVILACLLLFVAGCAVTLALMTTSGWAAWVWLLPWLVLLGIYWLFYESGWKLP